MKDPIVTTFLGEISDSVTATPSLLLRNCPLSFYIIVPQTYST